MDRAVARTARPHAWILEERQVEPGAAVVIAVEEVVDGRVVLVDGLLDEPEPEQAGIEIEVRLGVAGDRADVVDAVEFHAPLHRLSIPRGDRAQFPGDIGVRAASNLFACP